MKFGIINFFCQLKRTVCNREVSILKQCDCVCLEVVSVFPPLVFEKKNTLQKTKKLFKVSLLSLSKDSLVYFFGENLSNFCQFILVFNCDLR